MQYFLSRQSQWPTGEWIIEIAAGGLDRSGPGMLCAGWPELGEGQEYTDPREALETAFVIRKMWQKMFDKDLEPETCRIEVGYNCDMFLLSEEPTDKELEEWVQKEWEALPMCNTCGERITGEPLDTWDEDGPFCSEYCIERWSEEQRAFYEEFKEKTE